MWLSCSETAKVGKKILNYYWIKKSINCDKIEEKYSKNIYWCEKLGKTAKSWKVGNKNRSDQIIVRIILNQLEKVQNSGNSVKVERKLHR